mmetsp:Transcript_7159/g.10647  ORF Transcript_7159/g.10647 Transcript_7159/m.10647 type:complete len:206 (+) Transcript_7159:76-693(+)
MSLLDIEKAVAQILMSLGMVEDSVLKTYIAELNNDFTDKISLDGHDPLKGTFEKINRILYPLGFSVRTLRMPSDNGVTVFHGAANMDDDYVATTYGSPYSVVELQFFKSVCRALATEKHLSTYTIHNLRAHEKGYDWTNRDAERFLFRMHEDNWLQRDDRNFWMLGPRSHMELRSLIVDAIRADRDTAESVIEERILELPQMLFY